MAKRANQISVRLSRVLLVGLGLVAMPIALWWTAYRHRPAPPHNEVIPPAAYWVVGDGWTLRADAEPVTSSEVWDGSTIRLQGMRNEVIAWQLAARPADYLPDAAVAMSPLSAGSGRRLPTDGRLELFRAHPLTVTTPSQVGDGQPVRGGRGPGTYPAMLLPLRPPAEVSLPPGKVSSIWFDYWIPPDAEPGLYRGSLKLDPPGDGEIRYAVELRVLDLDMPATMHCRNWFVLDPAQLTAYYGDAQIMPVALETRVAKLAGRHRATALAVQRFSDPEFDPDDWWLRHGALVSGEARDDGPCPEAPPAIIPLAVADGLPPAVWEALVLRVMRMFEEHGLLDRCVLVSTSQPSNEEAHELVYQRGRLLDLVAGPKLRHLAAVPVTPATDYDTNLIEVVDLFCSPSVTPEEKKLVAAFGGEVWLAGEALGAMPVIDVSPLGIAAYGPAAFVERVPGVYVWNMAYWKQVEQGAKRVTSLTAEPLTVNEGGDSAGGRTLNGDGVWVYPGDTLGGSLIAPSPRLKAFRRGAQDYEYLWLLKQAGYGRRADEFARRLVPAMGEWTDDPRVWHETRAAMARLLEEASG